MTLPAIMRTLFFNEGIGNQAIYLSRLVITPFITGRMPSYLAGSGTRTLPRTLLHSIVTYPPTYLWFIALLTAAR